MRRIAALVAALTLVPATAAHAQTGTAPAAVDPNKPIGVTNLDATQPGYRLKGREVRAIADRVGKIKRVRHKYKGSYSGVYTKGPGRWQVSYFSPDKPPKEIGQLYIDDRSGRVTEAWTGYQVPWTMARGYSGAFGRKVNSPWVWISLTVVFILGFFDRRRPFRILHLDLLVLAAFGISVAYFNDANVDTSVPILYPLLAYALARLLWVGLRTRPERDPAARGEPLRMLLPASWMAVAAIFLVGFRIGLNVTDSNVIDVGYAGVIGADRMTHGEPIYDAFPKDNEHGDTYGPVNYIAYIPFVTALGWSGRWDDLPAAHGAAITFDLLALLLCFLVGRRVRGPNLGIALAFAWAAYPFTLYTLACNANDALVTVFVLAALFVAASAPWRGLMAALGGLTKFATLGLAPLFAMHGFERTRVRGLVLFGLAFAAAAAWALSPLVINGDSLATMYDRSIAYQAERNAPFSIWGLYDLDTLQHVWQGLAVLLAVGVALVPRRRDVIGLAALAGAVLIALQLGVTYWFYLYIVWFFPLVMLAVLGRYAEPDPA
ncbi:MAG TPA: hypothetical protein VFZ89_04825 [Solirubrobacteraceae bacterium]